MGGRLIILARSTQSVKGLGPVEVWSSRDGFEWTPGPTLEGTKAVGDGVGSAAGISIRTADGFEFLPADLSGWQTLSGPLNSGALATEVVGEPGALIMPGAIGYGGAGAKTHGAIWTSASGSSWQIATIDDPAGRIEHVFAVGGGFLATGSDQDFGCLSCFGPVMLPGHVTWFSPDGRTWTRTDGVDALGAGLDPEFLGDGTRVVLMTIEDRPERLRAIETVDGLAWHELTVAISNATTSQVIDQLGRTWVVGSSGLAGFSTGTHIISEAIGQPVPWFAAATVGATAR